MTDRPIIFSAPMVLALLAGRKTQTLRLATGPLRHCQIGDHLYVREAFAIRGVYTDVVEIGYRAHQSASHTEFVEHIPVGLASGAKVTWPRYRPSIHMPRWASRLTLVVTDVRVQPLQAVSEKDAQAEGVEQLSDGRWLDYIVPHRRIGGVFAYTSFMGLWNSLHDKPGEGWDDNPEIVALTFEVHRGNIDHL